MTVNGIAASYYGVSDLERATAFYTKLLGVAPTGAMPDTFSEWVLPDGAAFGLYKGSWFRPSDGVMFAVDDVHAAIADCTASGAEMSENIRETPVCFMASGNDSEGNGFILHQHKH